MSTGGTCLIVRFSMFFKVWELARAELNRLSTGVDLLGVGDRMKRRLTAKAPPACRVSVTITAAALVMNLGGCMVGPDYVRPDADVNSSWLDSSPALQDEPAEIREWWTVFDDPVLTSLLHEAYEQNLSLRAAGLRVIQARAVRGIAVGEFFPQARPSQTVGPRR